MKVKYILIKGSKCFKCYNLLHMSAYFNLSINNGCVICDGHQDTMSYSNEWGHEEIIIDFMRNRVEKVVPEVEIYKVEQI